MIERPTIIEYREPVVYVVFIEDGYNNQVFHTAFTKKSDAEELRDVYLWADEHACIKEIKLNASYKEKIGYRSLVSLTTGEVKETEKYVLYEGCEEAYAHNFHEDLETYIFTTIRIVKKNGIYVQSTASNYTNPSRSTELLVCGLGFTEESSIKITEAYRNRIIKSFDEQLNKDKCK